MVPDVGGRTGRAEREPLVAFDLLSLNGEDLRQRPLEEGRAELSRLVAGVDNIVFGEALVAEGALVFARACGIGEDLRQRPLEEGRAELSRLVAASTTSCSVSPGSRESARVRRPASWAWRGSSRSAPAADIRAETAGNG